MRYPQAQILASAVSSLLISLSKAFFISVTVFLTSNISFWLLVRILIYPLTLPICYCMLSTLCIKALSVPIKIVLSFWFDNFNISAISESFSDGFSISSNCDFFLPFNMSCYFSLIARHDVLGKSNHYKWPLVTWVVRCAGRGSLLQSYNWGSVF